MDKEKAKFSSIEEARSYLKNYADEFYNCYLKIVPFLEDTFWKKDRCGIYELRSFGKCVNWKQLQDNFNAAKEQIVNENFEIDRYSIADFERWFDRRIYEPDSTATLWPVAKFNGFTLSLYNQKRSHMTARDERRVCRGFIFEENINCDLDAGIISYWDQIPRSEFLEIAKEHLPQIKEWLNMTCHEFDS